MRAVLPQSQLLRCEPSSSVRHRRIADALARDYWGLAAEKPKLDPSLTFRATGSGKSRIQNSRFGLRWVIKWQILPKSCPDAWFRLATAMLCMNGRIDTFDSSNLIRKIETFSQVSGNDRSIPRKTPEFWRAVFGFASRRSAAAGPQARI